MVDSIQKGLLFLKPNNPQESTLNIINGLKTSLSHTLDVFPPLAGRLAHIKNSTDNTSSFFIDCNDEGAEFTHATALDTTVADILETTSYVPNIVKSFFSLNGVRNYEGVSKPLLGVQVTELVDGFFIGCTINHCVADGTSFWHFFNSWSEISRTNNILKKPPILKRWFPADFTDHLPIHVPLNEKHLYDEFVPPMLEERVFHFSKKNIAQLKAKANSEFGTPHKICISSLQAVLAHLWQSVIRCRRGTKPDEKFSFKILIGARSRLEPPLPEGYFGNAVNFREVTITAGELLAHDSGWAALQMNNAVAMHTDKEVKSLYHSWVKTPQMVKKSEVVANSLIASSSPRFDVYGNDFGWGRPVAVRSGAGNKHDGKITIFSGAEEGSIDIEVCSTPETLHAMGEDMKFMGAVRS